MNANARALVLRCRIICKKLARYCQTNYDSEKLTTALLLVVGSLLIVSWSEL